ncbi:TetR/AcrR family transcriptional regulator [Nocardioides sp. Leaf307]|uniref:TetR/AcrR family transcriptional regulator n=1 Tax=Nocardioides sp. Leaf307 TaxID=1736331 RepID=UPI0009EB9E14|nr:TetR/AcrR family transcriptional regulator [Nocardioides sp. Leaf307]
MSAAEHEQAVARRRARTRGQLVTAGRSLVAERGVSGLRVQEITERAGVALGSFYNHFGSKDDLVATIAAETMAELVASAVHGPDDPDTADPGTAGEDPAVTAARVVRRVVRLPLVDPGFARLLVHLNHADTPVNGSMAPYARRLLVHGIAAGRFRSPDPESTVTHVVGGAVAMMRRTLAGERGEADAVTGLDPEALHVAVMLQTVGLDLDDALAVAAGAQRED